MRAAIVPRVVDPMAGLPGDVREALAAAPDDGRALLELRLGWWEIGEAEARIAGRLRVFLLTWDPLEWVGGRGPGWATATGDGDDCEVVLYLTLAETLRRAEQGEETAADVLGAFAGSVLAVGARYEQALVAGIYPQLAQAGEAPSLLAEAGSLRGSPAPELALARGGWEPIGLGAIQDLVQEAFGPVDLDRSRVRLEAAGAPAPGCPACAGRRFAFPADLADQGPAMCALHAERAAVISHERLARAEKSNPEGWEAIARASSLLGEPTFGLPLALLRRLDEVGERYPRARSSTSELRADAELALALAERLRDSPDDGAAFLDSDRVSPDWLVELPMALSAAGLVDEAVAVGDALAELDQASSAMYANDVAVILAEAGRAELALQRVEANLRRFPDDVWTRVHAGDVHRALSAPERAEAAFREALVIAHAHGDAYDVAGAEERLSELLAGIPEREREARAAARDAERAERAARGGSRLAPKVGRNEPCPCGSGRKHKRCCGA
ncbi:MAG: SEC-C domain-containing protein [Actinobacteria bacterium]|nr:SEC-C domain-containing protein [Actinomycetota bacterium]